NVVPGYAGTVHLTSSDRRAVLPADYTFTAADAGKHTFTATLVTAGTQSLNATDTTNTNMNGTETIVVQPAAAWPFKVTGSPSPATAGGAGRVRAPAYDAYGNLAPGYAGTVQFTSSDRRAVLPANYTFTAADAGKHPFAVPLVTAGSQWIAATDTATPTITG